MADMKGYGIASGVISMVTGLIILLVGVVIAQELNTPINASLGAGGSSGSTLYVTANATQGMLAAWGVFSNTMSALTIAGVALIIIGAAIILSIMLGFGGQ
jgi:hypothetical protein